MLSQFKLAEVRHLVAFLRIAALRFRPIQVANSIKCPYCSHNIPANWEPLYTLARNGDPKEGIELRDENGRPYETFDIQWMTCFNDECNQVIVRIRKSQLDPRPPCDPISVEEWLAVPRKRVARPIDPFVPEQFSKPYIRASLILEDAPEMSGVLSRRILADLLKTYTNLDRKHDLPTLIDKFAGDVGHPSRLRNNLHYLREIGNFGAHTQTDEQDNVIEIEPIEAEWTLNVIDDLFDYFIVGPEKDSQRRAAFDEKVQRAGRKAIKKPGDSI